MSNAEVVFINADREENALPGQEVYFDFTCPSGNGSCHTLPIAGRTDAKRSPNGKNGQAQWDWDGNRELPTFRPSINCMGCWHGYIEKGRCVNVHKKDEPEPLTRRERLRRMAAQHEESEMPPTETISDAAAKPAANPMTGPEVEATLAIALNSASALQQLTAKLPGYLGKVQAPGVMQDMARHATRVHDAITRIDNDRKAKLAARHTSETAKVSPVAEAASPASMLAGATIAGAALKEMPTEKLT